MVVKCYYLNFNLDRLGPARLMFDIKNAKGIKSRHIYKMTILNIGFRGCFRRRVLFAMFTALVAFSFKPKAANITWNTAAISGDDQDVCTLWKYNRAYNLGAENTKTNVVVNGVYFRPLGDRVTAGIGPAKLVTPSVVLVVSSDNDGILSEDGPFGAGLTNLSPDYRALLQSGSFDRGTAWALILNRLTVSNTYLIQLWFNDSRGANHTETLTGGTNTSSPVNFNTTQMLGGLAQHITGIFTADGPSQSITFNPVNGPVQLNAFQVRVATNIPPPIIFKSPASLKKQPGEKADLNVVAWGLPPLAYHWQKISTNDTGGLVTTKNIAETTNETLSFASLTTSNVGNYRVVISNLSGSVTSAVASVVLTPGFPWIWTGLANRNWDTHAVANWSTNGIATTYTNGIVVQFDDTAIRAGVSNGGKIWPFAIIVSNNSKPFTIDGKSIIGNGILTKRGTNMLVISSSETNTYAGGTFLKEGIISVSADRQLGTGRLNFDGGTLLLTGSKSFASVKDILLNKDGGTIQVNNAAGATFNGRILGSGCLTKSGTGTLTLAGTNSNSSGKTVVNEGKLLVTTGGWHARRAIGSGLLTINPGATAEFTQNRGFDYGSADTESVVINGGLLQLDGNNFFNVITMAGGSLIVTNGRQLVFVGGAICNVNEAATTATIKADTIMLLGRARFIVARGSAPVDINVMGNCTNIGTLIKIGDGVMALAGTNSYYGPTTVSNGTLQVNGSIGTNLVLVCAGAMLRGKGIIGGETTVQSGGTLSPGIGDIGTLTIRNSLTLGGNAIFRISKNGNAIANDKVEGVTSVTYGGSLTVTNISRDTTTLSSGDTFKLFSATAHNLAFASVTLPPLPAGLGWDTNGLATTGILKVINNKAP